MSLLDEPGDSVAVQEMNTELRHAQKEALSAQLAADRLWLRFSVQEIARHAQRDILRKAVASANALHDYYNEIIRQIPNFDTLAKSDAPLMAEEKMLEAIARVARYLHEQRELFRPIGLPLQEAHRMAVAGFFSHSLLQQIRTVTLHGRRFPNPPFYADAKAQGLTNLPELTHMASLTFEDVVIFHEEITSRALFHALVHAVQFQVLGLERYTQLFVRGFLRTGSHVSVPLEAHVFSLDSRFAEDPGKPFSVEEKVRLWANQGRY